LAAGTNSGVKPSGANIRPSTGESVHALGIPGKAIDLDHPPQPIQRRGQLCFEKPFECAVIVHPYTNKLTLPERKFNLRAPSLNLKRMKKASAKPLVGILMGSDSDWPTMKGAADACSEIWHRPRSAG